MRASTVLFVCATITTTLTSGVLGRTHAAEAPTPGLERPTSTGSPFATSQAEVVRRVYGGCVHGDGVARLTDGNGHVETGARSWVAWSDGEVLFIDVQGILTSQQAGKVRWKVDLADGVTRFTVSADEPEAAWFHGGCEVHTDDLLKLIASGFKDLQAEVLPAK